MLKKRKSNWIAPILFTLAIVPNHTMAQDPVSDTLKTSGVGHEARGLVRSGTRVDLRTELMAPVSKTPFEDGQTFKEGDLLIAFDCAKYEAELKAAKAEANATYIESKTKKRLLRLGAAGRDEVSLAAARSVKASAELNVHRARNKGCKFHAPFSGKVVALHANVHEYPPNDQPLITIIDDDALELEMVIPSKWLSWVEEGLEFSFKVDETGETLNGTIDQLGAEVDPVSQTIKIISKIDVQGSRILAGMSGTAFFTGQSG